MTTDTSTKPEIVDTFLDTFDVADVTSHLRAGRRVRVTLPIVPVAGKPIHVTVFANPPHEIPDSGHDMPAPVVRVCMILAIAWNKWECIPVHIRDASVAVFDRHFWTEWGLKDREAKTRSVDRTVTAERLSLAVAEAYAQIAEASATIKAIVDRRDAAILEYRAAYARAFNS